MTNRWCSWTHLPDWKYKLHSSKHLIEHSIFTASYCSSSLLCCMSHGCYKWSTRWRREMGIMVLLLSNWKRNESLEHGDHNWHTDRMIVFAAADIHCCIRQNISHLQNRFLSNADVIYQETSLTSDRSAAKTGTEMNDKLSKLCEWKRPQNGKMRGSG